MKQTDADLNEIPNIGKRRELFVDDWLIDKLRGARLRLHRPERREAAMTFDAPWEDTAAFPNRVLPCEGGWRLYYRAGILDLNRENDTTVFAMAETSDGINFTRPDLGLLEVKGTRRNNVLQVGGYPNVPPPFLDTNPACPPDQRFKGLCAHLEQAHAMSSSDGLRWAPMQQEPLDMPGQFDTINTSFWDRTTGCYRSFTRCWFDPARGRMIGFKDMEGTHPVRCIQHATSPDFIHWSAPEPLRYADGDDTAHMYTNAILPCPGAEHIYLGFPNRYVQERKLVPSHPYEGVNDALFMASRDAVHWTRWLDAWVWPGLDPLNWTDRNNYPAWGIAETSPTEWSMYISEHFRHAPLPTRIRRLAIRPWGFVSVHADHCGGEMLTKPFTFAGSTLHLNAATSAAGFIAAEVQDHLGQPLPGFSLADMTPWYGDELDAAMTWKGGSDLSARAGQPIRLRFVMKDADLFALRFHA